MKKPFPILTGFLRFFCILSTFLLTFSLSSKGSDHPTPHSETIHWVNWSPDVFEKAKKEHRFVLLDLEAVWCHWCHVMDETTYQNAEVIKLMASQYIAVRVDQDSRPDLSNRYEDYGWPATVVFNSDGSEIVKRAGYIPPEEMISMLNAIIKDPSPGPSIKPAVEIRPSNVPLLDSKVRSELQDRLTQNYDSKRGGWGKSQKFLEWDNVEYCIEQAHAGDARAASMAKQTLAAQLKLIDPVWGGVYQYSTDGDWDHPHFEKIMEFQSGNLRAYALAYALWKDPIHLKAAEDIHRFLKTFLLSPEGAFYTSQDADLHPGEHSAEYFQLNDAGRRKLGIPRIDQHIYSRENGWAIQSLTLLYSVTRDPKILEECKNAADWIVKHRGLKDGGFRHDAQDPAGPYLGDTLAMGRAFLNLYMVTGESSWLEKSEAAARFIESHFTPTPSQKKAAGFSTTVIIPEVQQTPVFQFDENIAMARYAKLLFHYTGEKKYKELAEQAMCYLASSSIALSKFSLVGGILLADSELTGDPVHITVLGGKKNQNAQRLFEESLGYPSQYKRIDWLDRSGKALRYQDVEYPVLDTAAVFFCSHNQCSSPIFTLEALQKRLRR